MTSLFPRGPQQTRSFRRALLAAVLLGTVLAGGQSSGNKTIEPQDIMQFLNHTLDWYHQLAIERQIAVEPSNVAIATDNRRIADEVVRLAFDFARGEAQSLGNQPSQEQASATGNARYSNLTQLSAKLEQEAKDTQTEIEGMRQKLDVATGAKRRDLQVRISETQSELDLINARKDAIHSMVDFVSGSSAAGLGASGLRAQIEALARSVPADLSKSSTQQTTGTNSESATEVVSQNNTQPSGIWGLTADLFNLSGKVHTLQDRIAATDALIQAAGDLRTPLISRLKNLSKQGDNLATAADTSNGTELAQQKKDLDGLTAQFKQISAAVLPISKQNILLGIYKTNLTNWQAAVRARYRAELKSLLLRVVVLLLVLAVVFALAEIWRKTIYRYIQDPRRRYQFLLLRKIVLWLTIALIIAFAFATELGSAATFAGLLTAGVAVALQNVILSVAGYFFLIGRFGVRVGDRVQIAGVTGEVVDIGLVRMHLMELGGEGLNVPTGRVVAFSNSIVFQPTAGLFKQIPGTHFIWHEIRLTLARESDYYAVEQRLMGVVESVFAEYREEMERQYKHIERTVHSTQIPSLQPKSWLHFTSTGLEVVIRYPVDLQHSASIDDRVTRELLKAIDREPKLTVVGSGTPAIRVSTDLTPASS